jgi:N-acetylglucosamine kinase-like BadF-type ATPase
MSIFIGIEGVGLRQAVAVAADVNGNILSSYRMLGEPLSLHTTDRQLLRIRLCELIREVSARAGRRLDDLVDATVCIGLSGVTFPYDAEVDLPTEFQKLEIKVARLICTGDAEIVFASHACAKTGSAILCHMGSTAYAIVDNKSARAGGWGPAIDDAGSGFWIGMEALKAIGKEYDSGGIPSQLWHSVDQWLGKPVRSPVPDYTAAAIAWRKQRAQYTSRDWNFDPRTAIFNFAHSMSLQKQWQWRAILSSLSIPVIKAWEGGDKTAEQIVLRATDHLVRQYKQACLRVQRNSPISPLVLYGGVFTHNQSFRDLLLKKLEHKVSPPSEVLTPHSSGSMRPACGALLFALGNSSTGDLRLPDSEVISALRTNQARLHIEGELRND